MPMSGDCTEKQTNRQTDRQTDTLITLLRHRTGRITHKHSTALSKQFHQPATWWAITLSCRLPRSTVGIYTVFQKTGHTHTHTHPFKWAGTSWVKPIWILLKTVSGSGISWAICNSAPCSRQITMPAPHHSVFYRPDALPAAQPTASKHWRH